jgi:nucleoid-associated protein YgaU
VSLILGCAAASFAQDLGEIARQERERRKEQLPRATYVYTNDDLQRQHILVPKDQARVLAARRSASNPAVQVAQTPASPAPTIVPAAPAPIATPAASVSVAVAAAPAAPISHPPVSTSAATSQPKTSPLEAISRLVQEGSVRERPPTPAHHFAQPVIAYIPFGARPSPAVQRRAARHETATNRVSRIVFSRPQPRPESWEPVDLGAADVITVERGDSLWALAKRYLGKGSRWRELASLNTQIVNANVLHVGEWICLPPGGLQTAHQKITHRARAPAIIVQASALITIPSATFNMRIAGQRPLTQP